MRTEILEKFESVKWARIYNSKKSFFLLKKLNIQNRSGSSSVYTILRDLKVYKIYIINFIYYKITVFYRRQSVVV